MKENTLSPHINMWSKYSVLLLVANLCVFICMYFHNAITTLYVVSIGGSVSYAGIMLTCFTIVATVTRIISGRLLDTKGRRIVILIGLVIYAAATVSMTYECLPYLIVARIIQAIGFSMAAAGISVAFVDVMPAQRVGEGLGYFALSNSLGSAIGPIFAMWIYGITLNYGAVYYVSAMFVALAFIVVAFCRYEKDMSFVEKKNTSEREKACEHQSPAGGDAAPIKKKSIFSLFFERKALPCSVISLFINLGTGAIVAYLMLYGTNLSIENASFFFLLQALTTVIARVIFRSINDKYSALVSLVPGTILLGIGYFLLMVAPEFNILFFIAGACIGFGTAIVQPALNSEAIRYVPESRRGVATATYYISMDIGIGIGGFIWGLLIESFGFNSMFFGCIICMGISLILSIVFYSRKGLMTRIVQKGTL